MKPFVLSFIFLILVFFPVNAQEKAEVTVPSRSLFDSQVFVGLLSISILLMIVILVLAQVAKAAIQLKTDKERAGRKENGTLLKALLLLLCAGGFSGSLLAQETVKPVVETIKSDYWGMDGTTFYSFVGIIAFEVLAALQLYSIAMEQLGARERKERLAEAKRKALAAVKRPSLIEKWNGSVAIEKEADIMLDHDYDGIRELDNNLPPWWKYGFYLTIVFAFVYLFRFHISHTGKLQLAEYDQQLLQAKYEMAEYRKKAANLVDENNATLLTDGSSLASGKKIYKDNCVACHGNAGEGGVGPNLTDDYWLHQDDVKDVFKTIKYGYPEKGMKSWQQDLGAKQIHEVASYIKSLRGTHPANPKEPQGELVVSATADTLKASR